MTKTNAQLETEWNEFVDVLAEDQNAQDAAIGLKASQSSVTALADVVAGINENYVDRSRMAEATPPKHTGFATTASGAQSVSQYIIAQATETWPHRFAPDMVQCVGGRIYLIYTRASTHAAAADKAIIYRWSEKQGAPGTWTNEAVLIGPADQSPVIVTPGDDTGHIVMTAQIGITMTGRLICTFTVIRLDGNDDAADPIRFYAMYNDHDGDPTKWSMPTVFHTNPYSYARTFGSAKGILSPRSSEKYAVGVATYYRPAEGANLVVGYHVSYDDGVTWTLRGKIADSVHPIPWNESDFCQVTDQLLFAVSRGYSDGTAPPRWAKSEDGGTTWTEITSGSWTPAGNRLVAPTLDTVWKDGRPWVVMGMAERNIDEMTWHYADPYDLRSSLSAISLRIFTDDGSFENDSGYQSTLWLEGGEMAYVDVDGYNAGNNGLDVQSANIQWTRVPPDFIIPRSFPQGIRIGTGSAPLSLYEEGESALTVFGSTTPGSPTISEATFRWQRIGKRVHGQMRVALTAKGGMAGQIRIGGLPYTARDATVGRAVCPVDAGQIASTANLMSIYGVVVNNTNQLYLQVNKGSAFGSFTYRQSLEPGDVNDTFNFVATVSYEAA